MELSNFETFKMFFNFTNQSNRTLFPASPTNNIYNCRHWCGCWCYSCIIIGWFVLKGFSKKTSVSINKITFLIFSIIRILFCIILKVFFTTWWIIICFQINLIFSIKILIENIFNWRWIFVVT